MHDELWAGVESKWSNTEFHFQGMGQSLQPPEWNATNVALESAGVIIDTGLANRAQFRNDVAGKLTNRQRMTH
jgi:hypothetical protein